ncbi:MAG: hypothetical protein GX595_03355, partial [Lentisphaerae bacterium]|nr:hypothetical protein [Lentisphaerota bacterium]
RRGAGATVYLNFTLPAYDLGTLDLVEQLTRRAGIARAVRVEPAAAGAEPPRAWERRSFQRGPITVHGLIRDHRRCQDQDPVRLLFTDRAHVYASRTGQYLGEADAIETALPPGETALYACLPYRVEAVALTAPARQPAGSDLAVAITVQPAAGTPGDHVLHLAVADPDGRPRPDYTRNLLAPAGRLTTVLPLAANDPPGTWTLHARDVLTGQTASARVEVTLPPGE